MRTDSKARTGEELANLLGLSKREARVLDRVFTVVSVPAGGYLCWEGSNAIQLSVILDGVVEVRRSGETVCELNRGAIVGETRVLDNHQNMTADVVCKTACRVAVAGRSDVSRLCEAPGFMGLVRRAGGLRSAAAGLGAHAS